MSAQTQDRMPAWLAYSGVAVVGGSALAVLAWYQHLLGVRAHMPEALSWTFSVGLDWGSVVSGVFWFFSGDRGLRVWAMGVSLALITASTVMTCVSWGLASGWQWAALGVIHPLVFFSMAKLLTMWQAVRSQDRERLAAAEQEAEERAEREQLRAEARTKTQQRRRVAAPPEPEPPRQLAVGQSVSAQVRHWLRAELAAGREPTGAQADERFKLTGSARVGSRELRKVQAELAEMETAR